MKKFKIIAHTDKGHKITMCYTKQFNEESAKEIQVDTREKAEEIIKELNGLYESVKRFEIIEA